MYQTSGHLALDAALRLPELDFLCSPCGYGDRGPGGVSIYGQNTWTSLALHGKLFYCEADIRTYLCSPDSPQAPYRSATTAAESIALLQREFAHALIGGKTLWWFDMDGGWYDDPGILEAVKAMHRVGAAAVANDLRSVSRIAVVFDPESWLYKVPAPEFDKALGHSTVEALARMGAPWDGVLLRDLGNPQLPDYALYIFVNAFHLSAAAREVIERKVKQGGRTAVWVYAPGVVNDSTAAPALCREAIGITLRHDKREAPIVVDVLPRLAPHAVLGNPAPAANVPVWYADDPEAAVLGTLRTNGKPGLVMKRFAHWTSVYSAAPLTEPSVLRALAHAAGVHIYSDSDDACYVNNRYVCLHARNGGRKRIRFPEPVTVTELFTGRTITTCSRDVVVYLDKNATGIYPYLKK